jgi:glutamine synthetase
VRSDPRPAATTGEAATGTPVTAIRVLFPDLHGVARGKEVPIAEFDHVLDDGLRLCAAVMGTDLRQTPVVGGDEGYPDLIARPDMTTMATLPWEPATASCLADLEPAEGGAPIPDPRGALHRAVEDLRAIGLEPFVGPELEFFLLQRDPAGEHGIRRRVDHPSMVYTTGAQADPGGVVREMADALTQLGLEVAAFNHEFMNSQYEINLRHTDALPAADRAFRLKAAVKEIAARHGLVATFMGKPFNDQGGSGTHLHVSLNRDGRNAFDAPGDDHGVSAELGAFTAGVLAHAAGLMAVLNPTINAYRRIQPDSLAPTHANWGWDNRSTYVRIPPERGGGTRIEVRVADGAANPYLAIAAVLAAGAHGVRKGLTPPPAAIGPPLPSTLDAALDALEGDPVLCRALGPQIVDTFLAVKRFEIERHRAWVSDWDIAEYLNHL